MCPRIPVPGSDSAKKPRSDARRGRRSRWVMNSRSMRASSRSMARWTPACWEGSSLRSGSGLPSSPRRVASAGNSCVSPVHSSAPGVLFADFVRMMTPPALPSSSRVAQTSRAATIPPPASPTAALTRQTSYTPSTSSSREISPRRTSQAAILQTIPRPSSPMAALTQPNYSSFWICSSRGAAETSPRSRREKSDHHCREDPNDFDNLCRMIFQKSD